MVLFIINFLNGKSFWLILLFVFITYQLISMIYFKIYKKLALSIINNQHISLQNSNDRLLIIKVCSYIVIIINFTIWILLSNYLFTIYLHIGLVLLLCLFYSYKVKSSVSLLDHIISLKFVPSKIDKTEYHTICGEVLTENGSYYVDFTFLDEKIKL